MDNIKIKLILLAVIRETSCLAELINCFLNTQANEHCSGHGCDVLLSALLPNGADARSRVRRGILWPCARVALFLGFLVASGQLPM
jgi:hypothetical protein